MISEYWNLTGREPFLSLTSELDFSQSCNFCRMLMNHKYFDFTQIRGKNDWLSQKNHAFGPFLIYFARWRFFQKNPAVTHSYIWAPNFMLNFRKKLMNQSQKNVRQTKGRTEGGTDRPYFIGPFWPWPRFQQSLFSKWLMGIHRILF